MLKSIFITSILATSVYAINPDISWDYSDNNVHVQLNNFDYEENDQDWVAVYKKDESNDWENVKQWTWVRDGLDDSYYLPLSVNLSDGTYEARYFLNNSYDVYDSFSFDISGENGGGESSISVESVSSSSVEFSISSNHAGDEDWVAVYRKGESNDWDNVIDWSWVKDGDNIFDLSNVESGTFELRLFFDNSYHVASKTEFEFDGNGGQKVLYKKSIDNDNDGSEDESRTYSYFDNGKIKEETYVDRHGNIHIYSYNIHGESIYDGYEYSYNDAGKLIKKVTPDFTYTYEYDDYGNVQYTYRGGDLFYIEKYVYNDFGKILNHEYYSYSEYYEDEFNALTKLKYDNQNRLIEYFNDSFDSNPIHYTLTYNDLGKVDARIDLSTDDDGVSSDHYYEYDANGYLVKENIDKYGQFLSKGDTDKVVTYEWR